MKKFFSVLTFGVIALFLTTVSFAMTADQIMDKVIEENSNFKTQKVELHMCIQTKGSPDKNYDLVIYVYNEGSNEKYAFIRFTNPESIKGLSFLSLGKDKEYLYMPAYHRVQRIAGSSKNSKFAGSDFTYNDLSLLYSQKEEGKYTLLNESDTKYVIEITPTSENSNYSKLIMTIDKKYMLPVKVEFYKDGKLYKIMENSEPAEVQGRWLFKRISVKMADGSSQTILSLVNTKFDLNIPKNFFTVRTLFMPILRY